MRLRTTKNYCKIVNLNIDNVLKNVKKDRQYTIPVFIPHLGCKHECIFCNQRKISGNLKCSTKLDIDNTIKEHLNFLKDSDLKIQIAFFGGSFTGINILEQENYLKIAYEYIKLKKVDSIRLSTRPDYISPEILELLKQYSVESIELGVQSMDDEVLSFAKRGHTAKDVENAAKLINSYGFNLGFQIMVGLPQSNSEKEVETIKKLLKFNPKELRIYPVYAIKPSELYDLYESNKYHVLNLDEAVYRSYLIMRECLKTDIKVIRIGLQSTEVITQNNSEIAGPICDNFGEYVISKLVLDKIDDIIKDVKISDDIINQVVFNVDKSVPESLIIGPKKVNKEYIYKKYNVVIKTKKVKED